MKKLTIAIVSIAILSGCATRGAAFVPIIDMKGKDAYATSINVEECQAYATKTLDAASGAFAGALAGALLGAALGAGTRYGGHLAQQGAIVGGVGGAASANQTQESIIKRCMAGRGYNVLN